MEDNMQKTMIFRKPSVIIDLECDRNASGDEHIDTREDEQLGDDDCVVTLDPIINSSHNNSKFDIGPGGEGPDVSIIGDDVIDLGLKIQDVVSLSLSNDNGFACGEVTDPAACFAETVSLDAGVLPNQRLSDDSFVQFSDGDINSDQILPKRKVVDPKLNGRPINWQPIVPLIDISKSPVLSLSKRILNSAGRKVREEEDCIVIDNDQKVAPDVIVLDDPADLDRNLRITAGVVKSPAVCSIPHSSSSEAGPLSRVDATRSNNTSSSSQQPPSLKRPFSPQIGESDNVKIARTDYSDDTLFLEGISLDSSRADILVDCDRQNSEDNNGSQSQNMLLSDTDISSNCAEKQVDGSRSSSTNGRLFNDDAFIEYASPSAGPSVRHLSGSGSHDGEVFTETLPLTQPMRTPSNANSFDRGERSSRPNNYEAVASKPDEDNPVSNSTDIQICSDFKGLVEYNLSDSEDGSSSASGEQDHVSFCGSSDGPVVVRHRDTKVSCSSSLATSIATATSSSSHKAAETLPTQCFYGNRLSLAEIASRQYTPNSRKKEIGESVHPTQSFQEDVVHISSDDDETLDDILTSPVSSLNRTHLGFTSETFARQLERNVSKSDRKDRIRPQRASKDLLIRPTKIVVGAHTLIPRECYMTTKDLQIILKQGSFKFDVGQFRLIEANNGRIEFLVPSRVTNTLYNAIDAIPESNSDFKDGKSRLTVCVDELTSMSTLFQLLQQIPEATEAETKQEQPGWKETVARLLKKNIPKRVAAWSRPRHWNKRFFMRYRSPKMKVNYFQGHPGVVSDDAFLNNYNSFYEMAPPIQVSGFSGTVLKLFTYPPPPTARGITVTNEDLFCLNAGEYVNDVIIDFYLKYLFNELLSERDRARTHVFSSFFYGHLVSISSNSHDNSTNLSIAELRHQKVRTWTRHVDLFSKDFIIVPINENYHWFLAIVCFPGLRSGTSDVKSSTMVPRQVKLKEPENLPKSEKETAEITNKPELSPKSDDVVQSTSETEPESVESASNSVKKNPCILIFDSLQGDNRWDVACTLREYLQVEWDLKKAASEGNRTFSKDVMKGCRPQCPQQPNYSDCGLYLLQYVEAFFEKPLQDFSLPVKHLKDWFDGSEARAKRCRLRSLILELKAELSPELEYDPLADGCCNDIAAEDDIRSDL